MMIPVSKIQSNGNIRIGNKKNTDDYKQLKESIELNGLTSAITVIRDGNNFIALDGHQRLEIVRSLKHETIFAAIIENLPDVDHRVLQHAANKYRVKMDLYEEIMNYVEIIKKSPDITIKTLTNLFGVTNRYIKDRLKLANLHKMVLKREIVTNADIDDLIKLSEFDKSWQLKAIRKYEEHWEIPLSEMEDHQTLVWNLLKICDRFEVDKEIFDELFTQGEIDDYMDNYKGNRTSETLFNEYTLMNDVDFLKHCMTDKYPDLMDKINSLKRAETWYHNGISWKKLTSYKNLDKIFKDITAWNNNYSNPMFVKETIGNVGENEETVEPEKRSEFYGTGTRLAKAISRYFMEHLRKTLKVNDDSLQWVASVIKGYSWRIEDVQDIFRDNLGKIKNGKKFGTLLLTEFVDRCCILTTYHDSKTLFKALKTDSFDTWFNNMFKSDKEFRVKVLNSFKKASLQNAYNVFNDMSAKKSEVVEHIAENNTEFKLKKVFKDNEANFWYHQPVKLVDTMDKIIAINENTVSITINS